MRLAIMKRKASSSCWSWCSRGGCSRSCRLARPRTCRTRAPPQAPRLARRACRRRSNTAPALPGTASTSRRRRKPTRANPHTQISFLGVPAADDPRRLGRGLDAAALTPATCDGYSQGDGASFVPDAPFDAGEQRDRARGDRRRRARGRPDRLSASASTPPIRRPPSRRSPTRRRRPPTTRASTRCPACRPDPDRHRARPRSRGRRHPHDQRARPGPVRAADLHAAGPARLVRQRSPAAKRRRT